MRLSIVIVTHNRRDTLRATLCHLRSHLPAPPDHEILIVDNASTDGTPGMLQSDFPQVAVIRRPRNEGVSARNYALAQAAGRYIMLIDDDSYPLDDAAARAMAWLDSSPQTAAVVGRVVLPNGDLEASALPGVVANGAVVFRKSALDEVGHFPREFFRQAEEYDLSFRLWNAGYTVDRFEDLVFRHEKVAGNRWPAWIHRLDLRNNLILAERYLPQPWRAIYRDDWTQRYLALAAHARCRFQARLGWCQGTTWRWRQAWRGRRLLNPDAFEAIFRFEAHTRAIKDWARQHCLSRIALADFGKNIYAAYHACQQAGVSCAAVLDDHPAFAGQSYRGLPILSDTHTGPLAFDGIVITNINPAQVERRRQTLSTRFDQPILTLWQPRQMFPNRAAVA